MKEKIVIITGASSGIGKAAANKFAQEGYTVVMGCRDLVKSEKVRAQIIKATQNPHIDLLELDISSFESIKSFCTTFKQKYEKLDILIHNAAYFNHGEKTYQLSPEHIELTFATNTIGPFLMTQLLLDHLSKSEDARILHACTTNIRHFFDHKRKIDFDNLQGEYQSQRPYNVYKMYGDSKMALWLLTRKMADEYKSQGIQVNAIQIPAIKIAKETINQFNSIWKIAARIQNIFSAPPETMADTYYYICCSDELKGVTGKLFNDQREIVKSSHYKSGIIQDVKQFLDKGVYPNYADNEQNVQNVWDLCMKLTKNA